MDLGGQNPYCSVCISRFGSAKPFAYWCFRAGPQEVDGRRCMSLTPRIWTTSRCPDDAPDHSSGSNDRLGSMAPECCRPNRGSRLFGLKRDLTDSAKRSLLRGSDVGPPPGTRRRSHSQAVAAWGRGASGDIVEHFGCSFRGRYQTHSGTLIYGTSNFLEAAVAGTCSMVAQRWADGEPL